MSLYARYTKVLKIYNENMLDIILRKPPLLTFVLIFIMVSINSIYNSLATAFGLDFPFTSFLVTSNDLFGDYFKVIFSYPHIKELDASGIPLFTNILTKYQHNNPYLGILGLNIGGLTHFHMTPLTTVISLLNLRVMQYIAPIWLYFISLCIIFLSNYYIFSKVIIQNTDKILWFISLLICYPTLQIITRGNIFAGITFTTIIGFLVLAQKQKMYTAFLLLAIAVNIRPNAIIFIFAIINSKNIFKDVVSFVCIGVLIFVSALYYANIFYPDYTIAYFLSGLRIYHSMYVIGNGGLAYGSSLFGAIKLIFGANPITELCSIFIPCILLLVSSWLKIINKIPNSIFVFNISSCYVLGSSVFADYHLGVFLAPLLLYSLEFYDNRTVDLVSIDLYEALLIFSGSILMLVPKSYIFINDISLQVFINPFILLLLSSLIVYYYGLSNKRLMHKIATNI